MNKILITVCLALGLGLVLTGCNNTDNIGATTKSGLNLPGTATTTIAVGKTGKGKLCLYNGSNFTIVSFPSNSVTPSYATSTACQ